MSIKGKPPASFHPGGYTDAAAKSGVTSMFSKISGQPVSYEKKNSYRMGKILGAGTYGVVREAEQGGHKYAIKVIMKKNVKGNEQMVYDELEMLQRMKHPHIVRFHDWFESKDKFYIVTQLATGGELFDRICERGKFTERDASQTIRQVFEAVDYLHYNNVVHRDLKPENLLYVDKSEGSPLVLADFGIAKMLDSRDEVLTTMAGSFGYAAPEIMLKKGHGKAVDIWSLENLQDLMAEIGSGRIVFHERYWKGVSQGAKDFIIRLLKVDPDARPTSEEALRDVWLTGETATQHNIVPELRAFLAKARLKRGIEVVKLARRIEALRMMEDEDDGDIPHDAAEQAGKALEHGLPTESGLRTGTHTPGAKSGSGKLSKAARSAIFREVVLAKVREMKLEQEKKAATQQAHSH